MNLLKLPEEIQRDLSAPPEPLDIHAFSERRLRELLRCGDREQQLLDWRRMLQEVTANFAG